MTPKPEPVNISLDLEREFEDLSEVIEALKQIRLLDAVSDFDNQLFDISGEESIIIFTDSIENSSGQNNVIFAPESNIPPGDPEQPDPSTLRIRSNFQTDFDSMKETFKELLEPEEGVFDQLTVLDASFSFKTNSEFQSVETLKPLFEATDHNVTGIQFKLDGFTYIFQETPQGIGINVNSDNSFTVENHSFISQRLDEARPFVTTIIQGNE